MDLNLIIRQVEMMMTKKMKTSTLEASLETIVKMDSNKYLLLFAHLNLGRRAKNQNKSKASKIFAKRKKKMKTLIWVASLETTMVMIMVMKIIVMLNQPRMIWPLIQDTKTMLTSNRN